MDLKTLRTLLVLLFAGLVASAASASTLSYRMAIDGNYDTTRDISSLSLGTHVLTVEAIVTGNTFLGLDGGLLQSSFNLSTGTSGIKFTDVTGGFLGTPNGQWDSANLIPPWDTHLNGTTTNGGGSAVSQETSFMSPTNYNNKFQNVGANVYSLVAQGQFVYSGSLFAHISLTSSPSITRVAAFDGVQIVSVAPNVVNGTSIDFVIVEHFVSVEPDGGHRGIRPAPGRIFTQQFDETAFAPGPLTWSVVSFSGPTTPTNFGIDSNGLFTWDTTGVPAGKDQVYNLVVRTVDRDGFFDEGSITIVMPEPGTVFLAAVGLIGSVVWPRVSGRRQLP